MLHEYWMVLRNHVSAIDELGMATERLRVRLPDEPKQKLLHIIEPHEASGRFLGSVYATWCFSVYTSETWPTVVCQAAFSSMLRLDYAAR